MGHRAALAPSGSPGRTRARSLAAWGRPARAHGPAGPPEGRGKTANPRVRPESGAPQWSLRSAGMPALQSAREGPGRRGHMTEPGAGSCLRGTPLPSSRGGDGECGRMRGRARPGFRVPAPPHGLRPRRPLPSSLGPKGDGDGREATGRAGEGPAAGSPAAGE